jgi:hypothetical protein
METKKVQLGNKVPLVGLHLMTNTERRTYYV